MLDPNRYSLDAATVGFRKRMGLSVNWGNFNEAIQVQTEAIKVRRELEETPISEIHVMGGQGLGIAGNGKTNELARQSRQMNGYPLRSFYATGGAVVVPGKHGEGLLATPQNVGLTSYAQYNGVVGNYVSSFTEPLTAPMDSNIMLLARTGAQLRNESISNPYKVLQFQLNMNSSLEQIQANEKRHQELRGYNQESLVRDITNLGSAYSPAQAAAILTRKRNGASALIGNTATSQPGSGSAILAGSEAPGVQTKSRKKQRLPREKLTPEQEQQVLEYVSTIMPLEEAEQAAETSSASALQDLQTNHYAGFNDSLDEGIATLQNILNSPIPKFEPFDPVMDQELEDLLSLGSPPPIKNTETPSTAISKNKKATMTALEEEEQNKQLYAQQLANRYSGATQEEVYRLMDQYGVDQAAKELKKIYEPDRSKQESIAEVRQYELNAVLAKNTIANTILNQELPARLAAPLDLADDKFLGPTGTFKNPVEQKSIKTNKLMSDVATNPSNMDISSGAPNSKPSAGFKNVYLQSKDTSTLMQSELPKVYGAGLLRSISAERRRKTNKTPQSAATTGEKMSPNSSNLSVSPQSREYFDSSFNTPTVPRVEKNTLFTPKGNKIPIYEK